MCPGELGHVTSNRCQWGFRHQLEIESGNVCICLYSLRLAYLSCPFAIGRQLAILLYHVYSVLQLPMCFNVFLYVYTLYKICIYLYMYTVCICYFYVFLIWSFVFQMSQQLSHATKNIRYVASSRLLVTPMTWLMGLQTVSPFNELCVFFHVISCRFMTLNRV